MHCKVVYCFDNLIIAITKQSVFALGLKQSFADHDVVFFSTIFLQICVGVINREKTKLSCFDVCCPYRGKQNFLDSLLLTWEHFYKLETICVRERNMSQDIKFLPENGFSRGLRLSESKKII